MATNKIGTYQPTAWIRKARFGYSIKFGATGENLIPVTRSGTSWRPTRKMAQARGARYVKRERYSDRSWEAIANL